MPQECRTTPTMRMINAKDFTLFENNVPREKAMKQAPNNEACHSPYFALVSFSSISNDFNNSVSGKYYENRPADPIEDGGNILFCFFFHNIFG